MLPPLPWLPPAAEPPDPEPPDPELSAVPPVPAWVLPPDPLPLPPDVVEQAPSMAIPATNEMRSAHRIEEALVYRIAGENSRYFWT